MAKCCELSMQSNNANTAAPSFLREANCHRVLAYVPPGGNSIEAINDPGILASSGMPSTLLWMSASDV